LPILSERIVFPSLPIHEPPRCGPMHSRLFPFSVNGTSSFGYKHKGNFARTPRNMIQPLLKRTIPTIGKVNVTCENGPCHGVIHNLTCQSNFLTKYVTDCMIVTSFKTGKVCKIDIHKSTGHQRQYLYVKQLHRYDATSYSQLQPIFLPSYYSLLPPSSVWRSFLCVIRISLPPPLYNQPLLSSPMRVALQRGIGLLSRCKTVFTQMI
jgi:hypothetical protein